MTRLGLIASSALIAAATSAHAAPFTFQASRNDTTVALTCGPAADPCTRLKAKLDFDSDAAATSVLAPAFNFGFIEFEGIGPKKVKSDDKNQNSRNRNNNRNSISEKPKAPDQQEEFAGSYGITATLAFRILDVSDVLYKVIATGRGDFKVDDDDIDFLSLIWDEIPDVTIPGVGTFAFSFDNLGNSGPFLRSSSVPTGDSDEDTDDTNENNPDENLILNVNAQVENISVVPLPGGAFLLLSALGIIGVGAARRRRTATA